MKKIYDVNQLLKPVRLYEQDSDATEAEDVDKELKLNGKTNAVLQAAFLKRANIIPIDTAVKYMKEMIVKSYGKKGEDVVNKNFAAVDAGLDKIVEVPVPEVFNFFSAVDDSFPSSQVKT